MKFGEESILLAPMHVDALPVGQDPGNRLFQWTDLAPDFSILDGGSWPFGSYLVAGGDPLRAGDKLGTGIHLHFRIPAGLRRGKVTSGNAPEFPPLPNRWLVQRLAETSEGKVAQHRCFLVSSDIETPKDQDGLAWPVHARDGVPRSGVTPDTDGVTRITHIGRRDTIAGALPDEPDTPASLRITAVGQGDPMFTANYRASGRVIGLHDPLSGADKPPEGTTLSYLVTGWYSSATDDPLFDGVVGALWRENCFRDHPRPTDSTAAWRDLAEDDRAAIRAKLAEKAPGSLDDIWNALGEDAARAVRSRIDDWLTTRRWSGVPGGIEATVRPPWRLVCHGVVRRIPWRGADVVYQRPDPDGPSPPDDPLFPIDPTTDKPQHLVTLGEGLPEALSSLITPGATAQEVLSALGEGLLDQPLSVEELRSELHARRFEAHEGGPVFTVQPEPAESKSASQSRNAPGTDTSQQPGPGRAAPSPRVPKDLRAELAALNADQAKVTDLSGRLAELSRRYGDLWTLAFEAALNQGKMPLSSADYSLATDPDYKTQFDALKSALWSAADDLAEAVAGRDSRLRGGAPDAPVGPLKDALGKAGPDFRLTRTTAPHFHRFANPAVALSGSAARVSNAAPHPGKAHCRQPDQVAGSISLVSRAGVKLGISDVLKAAGLPETIVDPLHDALLAEALLTDPARGDTEGDTIHTEDFAFDWAGPPWIPLAMVWQVSFTPSFDTISGKPIDPCLIKTRWSLDETGDLTPSGPSEHGNDTIYFTGHGPMGLTAFGHIKDKLKAWQDDGVTDAGEHVKQVLEDRWAGHHSLDGFDAALLLRRAGPALPLFDYLAWVIDGVLRNAALPVGVTGDARSAGPPRLVGEGSDRPFLPVRDGWLRIENLSVVDIFGQTRRIVDRSGGEQLGTVVFRAGTGVAETHQGDPTDFSVRLRPRLVQPARLAVDLTTENDDGPGAIVGWVVLNWLEQSLVLHRADGRPLVVLQKRLGKTDATTGFQYLPIPEASKALDPTEIGDPDLAGFADWAQDLSVDEVQAFFEALAASVERADERVPEDDAAATVLVGRPFALVRAALSIELKGLPANRPAQPGDDTMTEPGIFGFEQVKWPLQMGDAGLRNDGLVGLFEGTPQTETPFQLSAGAAGPENARRVASQSLHLDATDAPLRVLMLMDPQARVHLTTGMLPRTYLELPLELAAGARQARDSYFQTAPVLGVTPGEPPGGVPGKPAMPVPSDDFGEWAWVWRPDVQTTNSSAELVRAAERGGFTGTWPSLSEGWLKLSRNLLGRVSLWTEFKADTVPPDSNITLNWFAEGAESVTVQKTYDGENFDEVREQRSDETSSVAQPYLSGRTVVTIDTSTEFQLIATAGDETVIRTLRVDVRDPDTENADA